MRLFENKQTQFRLHAVGHKFTQSRVCYNFIKCSSYIIIMKYFPWGHSWFPDYQCWKALWWWHQRAVIDILGQHIITAPQVIDCWLIMDLSSIFPANVKTIQHPQRLTRKVRNWGAICRSILRTQFHYCVCFCSLMPRCTKNNTVVSP